MSTHEPEKLLSLWQREEMNSEMAIGHLLQHLVLHQEAIKRLNAELASLADQVKHRLPAQGASKGKS